MSARATAPSTPRLYIFDADGTVRWTTVPGQKYPLASHEWRLMPGVAERLRAIPWSEYGPWLGVASNQTGVGEGLIDRAAAHALIVDAMVAAIGELPPRSQIAMCCCPPGVACARRKPAPGMLLHLLAHFDVAARDAVFVGDQPIDAQAAAAAGVPFVAAKAFFA